MDFRTVSLATGVSDLRVNSAKFSGDSLDVSVHGHTVRAAGLASSCRSGGTSIDLGHRLHARRWKSAAARATANSPSPPAPPWTDIAAAINAFNDVTGVATATSRAPASALTSDKYGSSEYVTVKHRRRRHHHQRRSRSVRGDDFATDQTHGSAAPSPPLCRDQRRPRRRARTSARTINGLRDRGKGKQPASTPTSSMSSSPSPRRRPGGQATSARSCGGFPDHRRRRRLPVRLREGDMSPARSPWASRTSPPASSATPSVGFLTQPCSGKGSNVVTGDNLGDAQKIVAESIKQVSSLRGRLGAFQKNTVGATIRSAWASRSRTPLPPSR
jgi:flagellin